MSWFTNIFKNFFGWFTSPKGKQVLGTIESLAGTALAIVAEINAAAPNRTLSEINAIATKYALPTLDGLGNAANGTDVSNVLLNLGTGILAKYAPAGTAKTIIQTALQIALSHLISSK